MYKAIKRLIDLTGSTILLVLLLPILLPICIILKFTGEGYIFYFQKRIGYKNKYFDIFKFATMLKDSPNIGTGTITTRNDPRVFPFGRWLRMTKINELPQIINVVKGDMSFVGPRPLVQKTFDFYPEDVRNRIYNSKPGITGIGSIIFRDEEKLISEAKESPFEFYGRVIAPYKGALEMWYQDHQSLKTDLLIVFLTVWAIIAPQSDLVYKVFKDLPERRF
jgi:lipopolysaccharide/colanic/teichoic acid biosynthesis glycosyltransferase